MPRNNDAQAAYIRSLHEISTSIRKLDSELKTLIDLHSTRSTGLIDSADSADPGNSADSARLIQQTSRHTDPDPPRPSTDEEKLKTLFTLAYPNSPQLDATNILSRTKALVSNKVLGISDIVDTQTVEGFDRAIDNSIENPIEAVAGHNWNYWRKIFKTQDLSRIDYAIKEQDGHYPDFIPPWELYKSSNGRYYHKDDALQKVPIPYEGRQSQYYHVPYSQTPPAPANWMRAVIAPPLGSPGAIEWGEIQNYLGDLFSVPPDARIALAFEKNELRLKYHEASLDTYLENVRNLLESLESFFIRDYNGVGRIVEYCYESRLKKKDYSTNQICWRASTAALRNEKSGFIVPPTLIFPSDLLEVDCPPVGLEFKDPGWQRSHYSDPFKRQWCRFICIQGLSNAIQADGEAPDWTLLIYLDKKNRLRSPKSRKPLIPRMFNDHLYCRQPTVSGNPFESSWRAFHITWNRLLTRSNELSSDRLSSTWKKGPLYSNKNYSNQQQAFTVAYFPTFTQTDEDDPRSYKLDDPRALTRTKFWTILLLAPESKDNWDEITYGAGSIFRVIVRGLEMAADDLDELRSELGKTINFESPIWNPELHDRLLSDDETFSRSRLYFWVVDALGMFHRQIEDAITEWSRFRDARAEMLGEDMEVHKFVHEGENQIMRLRELSSYFQQGYGRAETLRSALFNASSVIESRTSTRLSENVKLLTYVSIFYLPLGFCVAIWSINESYARVPLIITTLLVGVTTYFVVLNINNIRRASTSLYYRVREPIITRMANSDEEWKRKAEAFSGFQVKREESRPSEWHILYFPLREAIMYLCSWNQSRRGSSTPV